MSLPPNTTIYIKNLNDKIKRDELRTQLYGLFCPYGKVLDVVAQKGPSKKGQAFIVFRDLAGATSAMRSLDGEVFYDKKMQIEYAKSSSHATLRQQDPTFVSPKFLETLNGKKATKAAAGSKVTVSHAENDQKKRGRDEDMEVAGALPEGKKRRDADADDMEMDEDDEEEEVSPPKTNGLAPTGSQPRLPSALLLCENLPIEVTDDVLAVLFQQYSGFQGTNLSAPDPTTKSKSAHVRYDSAEQATQALEALNGFQIKRGWKMTVAYA